MDKLRIFFLTLFLVLMTAWLFVMVPVLTDMMKRASHERQLLALIASAVNPPVPRTLADSSTRWFL